MFVDLDLLVGVELRSRTHCGGGGGGESCSFGMVEESTKRGTRLDGLVVVVVACLLLMHCHRLQRRRTLASSDALFLQPYSPC